MKKLVAVYPGSFDPPTNGHLDILTRATKLFPKVIVAITDNSAKNPTFTLEERVQMLKETTKNVTNIEVDSFSTLLVNYLEQKNASIIIRGLRAISDFEYEFQMALMNRSLNRKIETVFLMPDERYTYLSSRVVKEVARLGGNVDNLVPAATKHFLKRLQKDFLKNKR